MPPQTLCQTQISLKCPADHLRPKSYVAEWQGLWEEATLTVSPYLEPGNQGEGGRQAPRKGNRCGAGVLDNL